MHDALRIDCHPDGLASPADGRRRARAHVDADDPAAVAVRDEQRAAPQRQGVGTREEIRRRGG